MQREPLNDEELSPLVEGLSGALAGVLSLALSYPLLVCNTRQQTGRTPRGRGAGAEGAGMLESRRPPVSHAGAEDVGSGKRSSSPSRPRAWSELYAGLGTASASTFVSNVIFFSVYARLASHVSSGSGALGGWRAMPVACAAGVVNVLATNPLWVLVTRLQVASPDGKMRVWDEVCSLVKEGGLAACWAGTWPALLMVSNPVIQFAAFEALAARHRRRWRDSPPSSLHIFCFGALAKLASTLVTYPALLLKSRRQASTCANESVLVELRTILRTEGLYRGLYHGVEMKMLQTVLASALLFTSREKLQRLSRRLLLRSRA